MRVTVQSQTIIAPIASRPTRSSCIKGINSSPLSGTLLASLVQNLGDHGLAIGVLVLEDVGGDVNEERVENALVPFLKDTGNLVLLELEAALEDVISLGDQLHITILDT